MRVLGSISALLALWLCGMGSASAQTAAAEKKQFDLLKAAAEKGDPQAQLSLGTAYASGNGVTADPIKAFKWHRKAAEQGLPRAQLRLAIDYADGLGVKSDRVEAVRWLRRAAEQGLADAQFQLGSCYATGDGVTQDSTEAVKWYTKSADQNYPNGQFALGTCYFEGNGVTKDVPEGVEWTRKAAEQGFALAENALGLCYAKGRGVKQDYQQAYKWFILAAAQGNTAEIDAKMNLSMAERALTAEQIAEGQKLAHEFKPHVASGEASSRPADPANKGKANVSTVNAPQTGFLTVKADDETYEVYADGGFVGNAPAKLKLNPGQHVIEVKKEGFKDYRKEIKVTEGSELSLRAVLEKQ